MEWIVGLCSGFIGGLLFNALMRRAYRLECEDCGSTDNVGPSFVVGPEDDCMEPSMLCETCFQCRIELIEQQYVARNN